MDIKNVKLGDVYYIVNKNHGARIIKGEVLEINKVHETVLLGDCTKNTAGNCGAYIHELYKTRHEAAKASRK